MGYAAHHSGGQLRLGVSATVASAVLYSAVVLFGLGSASPSAQGRATDRNSPVVRVAPDRAVSSPGKRLPQVSPGPARRHSHGRLRAAGANHVTAVVAKPIAAGESDKGSPAPAAATQPKPKTAVPAGSDAQSAPATGSTPGEPDPIVTVPDLPVTVPTTPVPLPPPPSVQVPALPGHSLP
jgi:hypothetical protein